MIEARRSMKPAWRWPSWLNWAGPLIGLVVVVILFSILVTAHLGENRFLKGFNVGLIATQTVIVEKPGGEASP